MTTLLFLGANPADTRRLALAEEVDAITRQLFATTYGSRYETPTHLAVHLDELGAHLIRYKPDLVHFGGHGGEDGQIQVENEEGRAVAVPQKALSDLFALWSTKIRCVVLSTCFSADQAAGIAQHVDCVVGMTKAVKDNAAIAFSIAFYQALGAGESVQRAFELGRNAVDLHDLPDADIPVLQVREGVKASEIRFTAGAAPGWFEGPDRKAALPVNHFTGRSEEMAALKRLLAPANEAACVVVEGLGGVGKASLVRQFVATEAPALFPAGVAWLDGTKLPSELQRQAIRFGWDKPQPPQIEEVLGWLTPKLSGLPVLFAVTDVDPADKDFNMSLLPILGGASRTVLTSRVTTLHEQLGVPAQPLLLAPWDAATGRDYLRSVVPALATKPATPVTPAADPAAGDAPDPLEALVEFAGRLPLALRLIARLLIRADATPASVLEDLLAEPLGALEHVATGADHGVAVTFNASFQHLDEALRGVLVALAASARTTRVPVVAAVAGVSEHVARTALVDLAERSLADFADTADRPWSVHAVLRLYLRQQAGIAAADDKHRAFATAHLSAHKAAADWKAMEIDAAEVTAAIDTSIAAGDGSSAAALLLGLAGFLIQRGRYLELVSLSQRVIALVPEGAGLADLHARLGQSFGVLGKVQAALDHESAALDLYTKLEDRRGQATAHKDLGLCFKILGDWPKAIDHLGQALPLAEGLGDRALQAKILTSLGICYKTQGDLPKAIDHNERALAIAEELHDEQGKALDLTNLGNCFQRLGDLKKAVASYEQSRAIGEALGDPRLQAIALANLSDCQRMLDALAEAIDAGERALVLAEKIGATEILALVLASLCEAYREHDELPRSLERGQRALALATQVGSVKAEAQALAALGSCSLAAGDLAQGLGQEQQALALADKLGDPDLQAMVHAKLGRHHRAAGDPAGARAEIQRAIELYRGMGTGEEHPELRRLQALLGEIAP